MSTLPKKEYEIQGLKFTLKPTTVANRKRLESYLESARDEMIRNADLAVQRWERERALIESRTDPDIEIPDEPEESDRDEYQTAFDMFVLLTDGPHEQLSFEDFDIKYAEDALENFLPSASRIASGLATLVS